MSTKHTPGPWSVGGKYVSKTVLLNARGESIASGGNNRSVQGEELEASLRLAAAAPDLLDAAQAAMNCIGELTPTLARAETMQALVSAVEKATGSVA